MMQKSSLKMVVLGTGGTIAGLAADPQKSLDYTAAQVSVADLLAEMPANAALTLVAEQVAQVDSKDMTHALWHALALRCAHWLAQTDVQAVLITHGTDTLEETAFFLQTLLKPAKPVVLTCAMRPANAPDADGPQNLRDALVVAAHPSASGVLVVCAGAVHSARDIQKTHAWRLDAFSSGEAGPWALLRAGVLQPLGALNQGQVVAASGAALAGLSRWPAPAAWPRVEIVWSHAGAHPGALQALLVQGVQGIVLAGTGNGRVHEALLPTLRQAQAAGVRVLVATRCADPHVLLSVNATPEFADAGGLSPVKARIALLLELLSKHV